MSQIRRGTDTPTIDAVFTYAVDTGEKIVNETMGDGDMGRRRTGVVEDKTMTVRDGRALRDTFDLETHGFEFVDHPTQMNDFFDDAELKSVYYKEAGQLLKARTGANRVHVFDHTLRSGDEDERNAKSVREPVTRVHNDYTEWSGPNRVSDLLPDEADDLLKRRFAIVQVWRAIRNPIESHPLGIVDARCLAERDLIISERRYPDRIGQTYQIAYNPEHEWYYFPLMTRDEALVFKVFDSATDGRARFTAHSAFEDPTSLPNAAPRESIEMRAIAFF
ncbi:MAG: methyltransferase [Rhodospirillaceae bacterium]|nr:methyltransferase [Rhodospirillaceae bacterium]